MTNVLRFALLTVAMSGLFAAPALAGGGSTKSKPKLTVENDTEAEVYVVVDPRSDFQTRVIQRIMSGASPDFDDAFGDLGGVILEGDIDDSEEFSVRKGNHTVHAALVSEVQARLDAGGDPDDIAADIAALFQSSGDINVQSDTTVFISNIPPPLAPM